ncbi:hypothetical protein H0H92_012309 [Tricholoma furcatifolium]|nr:hypothetical protein H0H92_012309 [Tricholoma furcatifolium]
MAAQSLQGSVPSWVESKLMLLDDPHSSLHPSPAEHNQMGPFSIPANRKPPVSAARRRKLFLSYFPDCAVFFALNKVQGYRREFSVTDTSLAHPYAVHERVPDVALYFICFVAPLVLQPVINLLTIRSWWDFHNSTLGLILGLAITGAITQFTKITVGRPRPDLLDRCQLPSGTTDPEFGLTYWQQCTQTNKAILEDGFRSFPSGHSSLSFAGLGFFAFYIAGKLHLFDRRGHAGKAWLSISPFCAAALVAISRTMDYRHHWQDVLVGSILGTVVSYFSYRQYYPSLASELSHRPYSPRIKRESLDILPTHHHHSGSVDQHDTSALPQHDVYGVVEGTVQRPELPLTELWQDGANEVSAP